MKLLQVNSASFSYGKKQIFSFINLSMDEGEIICLLGPNGIGKSTLLECILGLLPLQQGTIHLLGKNIKDYSVKQIADHIAYVPQLHQITFPFEVLDLVLMGRVKNTKIYQSPSAEDREFAMEALQKVGMHKEANRLFTELSGGQKQLVMIARALAQGANVIILDEPTAHLDLTNEQLVLETILTLVKETNVSILMSTHSPNHAFFLGNEHEKTSVAILHEGKLAHNGKPQDIITKETMEEVFQIESVILTQEMKGKIHSFLLPIKSR